MTFGGMFLLYFHRICHVFYKKKFDYLIILFAAYIGYSRNCFVLYTTYNFVKFYTSYTVKSKSTWKMCHLLKKYSHVTAAGSAKCHFVRYPATRNTALKSTEFLKFVFFDFSPLWILLFR